MTFTSIDAIADRIVKHHTTFAGHIVSRSGVRVWNTLMRAVDYINKTPAVVALTWEAELNTLERDIDGLLKPVKTSITIGVNADAIPNRL